MLEAHDRSVIEVQRDASGQWMVVPDSTYNRRVTATAEMTISGPADESTYFAGYPKVQVSAIAKPDNIMFDVNGNLWTSTDGQPGTLDVNDAVFAVPTDGPDRGYLKQFFASVVGGEMAGPAFTPDNTTFFVSVQHPSEGSSYAEPSTRRPGTSGPPRPTVVVIQKDDGGVIGS